MAARDPRWPGRALALTACAVALVGCGPASEDASLRLAVDERGSFIGVYAGTSAAGVEVDLDWVMVVRNLGPSPCAIAVYRWTDALPDPAILPSSASDDWPASWADGERVASAIVEVDGSARIEASEDPAGSIDRLLGLATCPGARLELDVRAEVSADLGVRTVAEGLVIELWRA